MPNTLAHIGVQSLLGKAVMPGADLKWVWAACVIPDLSWILQVVVRNVLSDVSLIDLRLYAIAQTSLIFCLILAAALAVLSGRPMRVFAILAFGIVLHLLLDATQTKWGNGVVLWAPFEWSVLNFSLYWPEQIPSYALTAFGLVCAVFLWVCYGPEPFSLQWPTPQRLAASVLLFAVWLFGPIFFMADVEAANLHDTRTMRHVEERPGKTVTIDRNTVLPADDGLHQLRSWTGEIFTLEGAVPAGATNISVKGTFTAPDKIAISSLYVHTDGPREWFTYVGLLLVLLWWAHGLVRSRPK